MPKARTRPRPRAFDLPLICIDLEHLIGSLSVEEVGVIAAGMRILGAKPALVAAGLRCRQLGEAHQRMLDANAADDERTLVRAGIELLMGEQCGYDTYLHRMDERITRRFADAIDRQRRSDEATERRRESDKVTSER